MFNGKYKLNSTTDNIVKAFGLSDDRYKAVMDKLNAVANIYPSYIAVAEVWLNCEERFTDKELAFGLFALGKIFGMSIVLNKLKAKMQYPENHLEGQLLKKLREGKKDFNALMNSMMGQGGH